MSYCSGQADCNTVDTGCNFIWRTVLSVHWELSKYSIQTDQRVKLTPKSGFRTAYKVTD